jgi:tetratricopeptide (TPR) repeat protein
MTQAPTPASKPSTAGFSIAGLTPSALAEIVQEAQRAVVGGTSLASQRHVTDVELKARLDAVRALCDKGQFEQALTGAIELHLLEPRDGRHAFVVGTCLQHLGKHAQALGYFTLAAFTEPRAAAQFRAGECLLALGHGEDAALIFLQAAAAAPANSPLHALAAAAAAKASPSTKTVPAQSAH